MIDEVRGLLDQYAQWVRDKTILREVNEQYVEITTPYLDRRRAPERLIRAVNRPSRDLAEGMAFSWVDTKAVRPPASKFYAFLNDENRPPTTSIVDALRNYDIVPIIWSARDSVRQELAA